MVVRQGYLCSPGGEGLDYYIDTPLEGLRVVPSICMKSLTRIKIHDILYVYAEETYTKKH